MFTLCIMIGCDARPIAKYKSTRKNKNILHASHTFHSFAHYYLKGFSFYLIEEICQIFRAISSICFIILFTLPFHLSNTWTALWEVIPLSLPSLHASYPVIGKRLMIKRQCNSNRFHYQEVFWKIVFRWSTRERNHFFRN